MRHALALLLLTAAAFAQGDIAPRPAPEVPKDAVWLDASVPHTLKEYRGRVVLVDFWEYTCINCIRDFTVVKRWYRKYHDYGFEVIGVHFGEFQIGYKVENVRRAAQRFQLPWPIVADVRGSAWQAFNSNVWPNRYLIDQTGYIVLQLEGEGNNRAMESLLRQLLSKKHPEVKSIALDPEEAAFAPHCGAVTDETYVGDFFGRGAVENPKPYHKGKVADFEATKEPRDGRVILGGKWLTEKDGMAAAGADDLAEVRYHARSVYAVMSPPEGQAVRVYLEQDGKPLEKYDAAADVKFDARGAYIDVSEPRMFYLVKNASSGEQKGNRIVLPSRLLTLKPQAAGLTLHSFTYGNNCQQEIEEK